MTNIINHKKVDYLLSFYYIHHILSIPTHPDPDIIADAREGTIHIMMGEVQEVLERKPGDNLMIGVLPTLSVVLEDGFPVREQ